MGTLVVRMTGSSVLVDVAGDGGGFGALVVFAGCGACGLWECGCDGWEAELVVSLVAVRLSRWWMVLVCEPLLLPCLQPGLVEGLPAVVSGLILCTDLSRPPQ